jgi:predicted dehydrogenase
MKLRLGLIGLGAAWAQRHRPSLRMLQNRFEVRAIFNNVPLLAEQAAREFGASTCDGYRALVRRHDIDAVLILENAWQGWLPITAACDAGKAVYWAADLDFDADLAAELTARVDRAGIAFMAEFPRRFAPATLRLKELIATCLGPPQLLFCHRRLPDAPPNERRNGNHRPVRRVEAELVELIDWCRYVVGREPRAVSSIRHGPPGSPDYWAITLEFEPLEGQDSPPLAQISCGRYIPASWHEAVGFRPPAAMQVRCQAGVAFIDMPTTLVWFDEAGRHLESLETELPVGEQLLTQFHRAVTSLVRKMGDLEDACRSIHILRSADRAAESGTRIVLEFPTHRNGQASC